jgi:hypothetical protein
MSSTYRRVTSSGSGEASASEDERSYSASRNNVRSLSERLTDKLVALAWLTLAVVVAYATDFYSVLLNNNTNNNNTASDSAAQQRQPNRPLLQLVAACLGINTILALYLTVYLPKVKGLTDSSAWPVYCPRIIPISTGLFLVATILFIRATWPVWGFLAPLLLGIQAMGAFFALHFVPWPF